MEEIDKGWELIWKLKIPNRVRAFLWLVKHKCIMSNVEQVKRHLAINDKCHGCLDQTENIEHIFLKMPIG